LRKKTFKQAAKRWKNNIALYSDIYMPNHSNQAHMRKIAIFLLFLITTISGFSQGKSVQGKVTGENGNPLEGVTIQVRGNAKGFQTDKNGAFTVPVPATGKTLLVFTYVGYKTYTLSTDGICIFC